MFHSIQTIDGLELSGPLVPMNHHGPFLIVHQPYQAAVFSTYYWHILHQKPAISFADFSFRPSKLKGPWAWVEINLWFKMVASINDPFCIELCASQWNILFHHKMSLTVTHGPFEEELWDLGPWTQFFHLLLFKCMAVFKFCSASSWEWGIAKKWLNFCPGGQISMHFNWARIS